MKRLIYLATFFAFFKINAFTVKISTIRLSFFEILVYLIAIILIADIFKYGFRIAKQSKYSITFFIIWTIFGILSYGWSHDKGEWLRHIKSLFTATLFILECNTYINNKKSVLNMLNIVRIMCIIHNLIGLVEIITGKYYFHSNMDYIIKYQQYNYPVSVFYNVNNYAVFILISLILSTFFFSIERNKKNKILNLLLIISSIFLIYMSGSRAVNIALIVGIAFYILFLSNFKTKIKFFSIGFVSILTLFLMNMNTIMLYINKVFSLNLQATSGSDYIRKNILLNCYKFLIDTFGIGIGPGNFKYWINKFSYYDTMGIQQIHNWWIEILVTYGVIIFILFCIFYYKLFSQFLSQCNKKINIIDIDNSILKVSLVSLICFSIASISPGSLMNSEWVWVYFTIMIMIQKNYVNKFRKGK